jgi:hypothetical protein
MARCGGLSNFRLPTEDSKLVLTNIHSDIKALDESLGDLNLENLLENHNYSTQVVAGLNYVFLFTHNRTNYKVTTWAKLDKTYQSRLTEMTKPLDELD